MTFPQGKVIYNDLPCLRGCQLSGKTAWLPKEVICPGFKSWCIVPGGTLHIERWVCQSKVFLLHPDALAGLCSVKARCLAVSSENVNASRLYCKSFIDGRKWDGGDWSAGTSKQQYPDPKQKQFTMQRSLFAGMIYAIWESSLIIPAEHLQAAG